MRPVLRAGAAGLVLAGWACGQSAPTALPDAEALLAGLHERVFARPFYAVATLAVHRPGIDREVLLRIHVRDPGCALVRAEGSPREEGTAWLRRDGRLRAYFPRADLVVDLPPSLGGGRLFGSDFDLDDVLAFGGDPSRFAAASEGVEAIDGVPCDRLRLRPRSPFASLHGQVRLWVAREAGAPRRLEFISERGLLVRTVTMEGGGKSELPALWKAESLAPPGGTSTLLLRFFERDPPLPPDFFAIERIRRWR